MAGAKYEASDRRVRDLFWDEGERLSAEQQALHPSIERINDWGRQHPEWFAGVWLENRGFLERTGPVRIGVGVAGPDVTAATDQLVALVDDPALLTVVPKALTEVALRAAQDRVVARWMSAGADSEDRVTGCGADITSNTLEVMLREPDPALEEQIRRENEEVPITIVYGFASPA